MMEFMAEVERVLDERVRPALHEHNGEIAVESFEDGILKVRLLGQCSNCPSAMSTTEDLVEEELCAALPQIRQVSLITGVSDTLLAQARDIMRQRSAEKSN